MPSQFHCAKSEPTVAVEVFALSGLTVFCKRQFSEPPVPSQAGGLDARVVMVIV